jgi:hypothetical protein
MLDELRLLRWRDFCRRADFSPTSVYHHCSEGWKYIPIHPFADETSDLIRLGMKPCDCRAVDAWWGIKDDATLVQVWTAVDHDRPAGLYARQTEHEERWVYLVAVLDVSLISRESFEDVLSRFALLGFPGGERFRLSPNAGLTALARA